MAPSRVGDTTIDIGAHGERRVHQHDGRLDRGVEMVVDMGGVVPGDGNVGKEEAEHIGAGRRKLVERY
ncbi:hypothetical protein [Mesorhizobium yinganensis]|uniref:hypothetical protein n=1 Tax=Mesorhizobium yinganensis TaxID=3157707 RepID=UPI003CCDF064